MFRVSFDLAGCAALFSLRRRLGLFLLHYRGICKTRGRRGAPTTHLRNVVHHTCRRANLPIIILVSRCSTPLLSDGSGVPLRRRLQGRLHGFFDPLGKLKRCLHFLFVAKVDGFDRVDVFDRLGGLGGVDVQSSFDTVYNVARQRLLSRLHPSVRQVTLTGNRACRTTYTRLGQRCSKCRFDGRYRSVCGPFDLFGTFSTGRCGGF